MPSPPGRGSRAGADSSPSPSHSHSHSHSPRISSGAGPCGARPRSIRVHRSRGANARNDVTEELLILRTHLLATDFDARVVLDPPSDQSETTVRRSIVDSLGFPAFPCESRQDGLG